MPLVGPISGSTSLSSRIGITGSVVIAAGHGSGGSQNFPTVGSDCVFYVSGTKTPDFPSYVAKSVFGGDLINSGNVYLALRNINGKDTDIFGSDVNFFVSGTTNDKDTAYSYGAAVFGGNLVVSGTIYDGSGNAVTAGGWTDGGTNVHLTTATDVVGIGVTVPNEELEVGGDGRAFFGDGGGSNRKGLLIDGIQGSTATRIEGYDYGAATGLDVVFNTVGGGNVGIGTSGPDCMLHVAGAAAFSGPSETFITFGSSDTTPTVALGNLFKTHASGQTLTMFDDGVAGQIINVISTAAVVYDVTGTNLKGGSVDITTADGDVTTWVFDGTNWYLLNFMDQSADLSGGH